MQTQPHDSITSNLAAGRLRIGLFTDTYLPQVNGVAISVSLLARQLREMGHAVLVIAPRFAGYREPDPNVLRLPAVRGMQTPPFDVALPSARATRALRQMQLDVIHAHTPLTVGLWACLLARLSGVPFISTYHTSITDYTHYLGRYGDLRLTRQAAVGFSALSCNISDQVVAPSAKIQKLLLSQGVRPPIRVVPNGIDLAHFQTHEPRGAWRRKLGVGADDLMLVSLGRLESEKSLDVVIEAFAAVAAQRPDALLVLAGDGSYRAALQEQAASTAAGRRILFPGMIDRAEVPGLLHEADLYLTASTTEVHPLSMIEAIACGLPVVGVRDEALQGMVADGVNGWITPKESGPFSAAVLRLLSDPAARQAFGQASLSLSQKYSIQAQAAALSELYAQLSAARAGARPAKPLSAVTRYKALLGRGRRTRRLA